MTPERVLQVNADLVGMHPADLFSEFKRPVCALVPRLPRLPARVHEPVAGSRGACQGRFAVCTQARLYSQPAVLPCRRVRNAGQQPHEPGIVYRTRLVRPRDRPGLQRSVCDALRIEELRLCLSPRTCRIAILVTAFAAGHGAWSL